MLEPILKGLVKWIYGLMVDIMAYASGELLGVMSMDLAYFEKTAPVIKNIVTIFIALGWALLIGNMVFQLVKATMSGIGFEAEDPKFIFMRTFVFAFLLLVSRQICDIGLNITSMVIDWLEVPASIEIKTPDESMFNLGAEAKWLLVIIVGVVLMVQMVKLLFEIGERYVVTSVLTFFAPLAFAMGGSKNTNDIFKGWCRMYCSMLLMMIMNIVFLKLIMSAMSQMAAGGVLIWLVFVVALTRVARKIDSHIGKIGLNPAQTGDGIGSRLPGMTAMMAVRVMGATISRSLAGAKNGNTNTGSGSREKTDKGHRKTNSTFRNTAGGRPYYQNSKNTNNTNSSTDYIAGTAVNPGGTAYSSNPAAGTATHQSNSSFGTAAYQNPYAQSKTNISKQEAQENHINGYNSRNSVFEDTKSQKPMRPPLDRNIYGGSPDKTGDLHQPNVKNSIHFRQMGDKDNSGYTIQPEKGDVSLSQDNREKAAAPVQTGDKTDIHNNSSERQNSTGNFNKQIGDGKSEIHFGSKENISNKTANTENRSSYFAETENRRINHEYKNGRYNPAAVNKKAKNNYFTKQDEPDQPKKRGGDDRKHKQ